MITRANYILLIPCAMLLSGCGERSVQVEATADDPSASYADVFAAAERTLAEAEARRNVWSKTESLLHASREAHNAGRTDEAIALATEARLQAELAIEQAEYEKEAWRSRVLPE